MAKIGLNNFYYSKLTEAPDGTPTFDGAKSLGKAVSASVSISNNSATLYADDALAESDTSFQNGTITLGVDDERDATFADLLGHTITDGGEVIKNVNDIAPYVAIARIVVKMVNNVRLYKVEVLYKVKFSEPSQDDNTKGESVEFATSSIEGTIASLANGNWSDTKTFATKAEAIAYILGLFAVAGSTFRVTYDANGGTGSIDSVNVDVGESTTLSVATALTPPSNKTFSGWALSSTATQKEYSAGDTFYPVKDTTFYAVWVDEA